MSYNAFRCFDIVCNVVIYISPSSPQTVTPTGNTTVSFNYWSNEAIYNTLSWTKYDDTGYHYSGATICCINAPKEVFNSNGTCQYYIKISCYYSSGSYGTFSFELKLTDFNTAWSGYGHTSWTAQLNQLSGPKTVSVAPSSSRVDSKSSIVSMINNGYSIGLSYGSGPSMAYLLLLRDAEQMRSYLFNGYFPCIIYSESGCSSDWCNQFCIIQYKG